MIKIWKGKVIQALFLQSVKSLLAELSFKEQ